MTRDQIMALTYLLPTREGDRESHLRAVVRYENPPPAIAFGGTLDVDDLQRRARLLALWRQDLQEAVDQGKIARIGFEIEDRTNIQHQEAIDQAIPMAEAGWKIYAYEWFIAVLVRPE